MELKHPEGYWVQQLTDENVEELLTILASKKKTKKFQKILKLERTDTDIDVLYHSRLTKGYWTYAENKLHITDFRISGGHSYVDFYEYMIEKFGEEYAEDFIAFAENYIAENNDDAWSKRLARYKEAVPAMVDSYKHNLHNDI